MAVARLQSAGSERQSAGADLAKDSALRNARAAKFRLRSSQYRRKPGADGVAGHGDPHI